VSQHWHRKRASQPMYLEAMHVGVILRVNGKRWPCTSSCPCPRLSFLKAEECQQAPDRLLHQIGASLSSEATTASISPNHRSLRYLLIKFVCCGLYGRGSHASRPIWPNFFDLAIGEGQSITVGPPFQKCVPLPILLFSQECSYINTVPGR